MMESSTLYFASNLSDQLSDSDNYAESSSEEADEELDEEEVDRRKCEYLGQMLDLERQFEAIKVQLYRERLSQAERKLEEIRAGVSEDYLQPLQELQESMRIRDEVAVILREFRLKNVHCQHHAEKQAAEQNYLMEQRMIKDQLRQEVEEKMRRLEEDRNSLENCSWSESSPLSSGGSAAVGGVNAVKKRKRYSNQNQLVSSLDSCYLRDQLVLPDRRKKPVPVNGPYVVYMLHDTEINEDWNQIKRAIKSSGNLSFC